MYVHIYIVFILLAVNILFNFLTHKVAFSHEEIHVLPVFSIKSNISV